MAEADGSGRVNQRRRTRKEILAAAARLMKAGGAPSLEEIAAEALVSRATAYRYFPGLDALLLEASLDLAAPEPAALFEDEADGDPVRRMERVDDAFDAMIRANEPALRTMLIHALQQGLAADGNAEAPARQNRRSPLIEAALAPARERFDPAALNRLGRALALVVGTEARLVFKDVLQVGDDEARAVKRWMMQTLIEASMSAVPDE